MRYIYGDIVKMVEQFDVVLQGNNCFHTMNAGIARQFREAYPQVYEADYYGTAYADRGKLGTYSRACVGDAVVLNCYTQYGHNPGDKPFDYDALRRVLKAVKSEYGGKRIAMPMIGSGLAGGEWDRIAEIIEQELDGEDVTVIRYAP